MGLNLGKPWYGLFLNCDLLDLKFTNKTILKILELLVMERKWMETVDKMLDLVLSEQSLIKNISEHNLTSLFGSSHEEELGDALKTTYTEIFKIWNQKNTGKILNISKTSSLFSDNYSLRLTLNSKHESKISIPFVTGPVFAYHSGQLFKPGIDFGINDFLLLIKTERTRFLEQYCLNFNFIKRI